jgi:hypothetical protein
MSLDLAPSHILLMDYKKAKTCNRWRIKTKGEGRVVAIMGDRANSDDNKKA